MPICSVLWGLEMEIIAQDNIEMTSALLPTYWPTLNVPLCPDLDSCFSETDKDCRVYHILLITFSCWWANSSHLWPRTNKWGREGLSFSVATAEMRTLRVCHFSSHSRILPSDAVKDWTFEKQTQVGFFLRLTGGKLHKYFKIVTMHSQ